MESNFFYLPFRKTLLLSKDEEERLREGSRGRHTEDFPLPEPDSAYHILFRITLSFLREIAAARHQNGEPPAAGASAAAHAGPPRREAHDHAKVWSHVRKRNLSRKHKV